MARELRSGCLLQARAPRSSRDLEDPGKGKYLSMGGRNVKRCSKGSHEPETLVRVRR